MQRLRRGIYLLEAGESSNCFLIEGPHGLILFDAGRPLAAAMIAEEIVRNGFALKDIDAIVLSHLHFSHAGGAWELLGLHRVKIFAHAADIPAIKGQAERPRGLIPRLRQFLIQRRYSYHPLEVVVPIDEGEMFRSLPQWQVLHLPGHTAGSIGLFQPGEKMLLCGDALSNREGHLEAPEDKHCENPAQARESIRKLASLDPEVLGCGHGPVVLAGAGLKIQDILAPLS